MRELKMINFTKFFESKLVNADYYEDEQEKQSDIEFAIENMAYDMENGMSLYAAFENACQQLYIESDGTELFI